MIDDAVIRRYILTALPALEPWRIEMEEIDFGDAMGCALRVDGGLKRFQTEAKGKSEEAIATELVRHIKAALPVTMEPPRATIKLKAKADGSSRS